jgi:hypothetical protein
MDSYFFKQFNEHNRYDEATTMGVNHELKEEMFEFLRVLGFKKESEEDYCDYLDYRFSYILSPDVVLNIIVSDDIDELFKNFEPYSLEMDIDNKEEYYLLMERILKNNYPLDYRPMDLHSTAATSTSFRVVSPSGSICYFNLEDDAEV